MAKRRLTQESHIPLHQRILEALERDIEAGKYAAGQRFPSEAALTRQYGTSRITIGRAVRELERRGLVARVAGSGTYVRARAEARATFGLVIPSLGHTEIFEPMCRGLAAAAGESNTALLLGDAGEGGVEAALRAADEFIERRVGGVFFTPLEETPDADAANAEIAQRLGHARIPLVLLDRDLAPYPRRSGHDLVGIDNRRAGYLAAEHLLEHGARRVAFVARIRAASTVDARIAGYREAVAIGGRGFELVLRLDSIDAAALVETGADAFVCANDRTAGEVMHALLTNGLRIPQDIRIAGIDDVEYATLLPVPLTTVRQPCRDIGEAAIAAMRERIAHPRMPAREILLECRLVARASG